MEVLTEEDVPHYSEEDFHNQVQLPPARRNLLIISSTLVCCPCVYWLFVKPNLPHYRGLPVDCQPLKESRCDEYLQRMEGSYSIDILDSTGHRGRPFPTYDKVEVLGNKMTFSGGTHPSNRYGQVSNQPSTKSLHFFEGKEKNMIFCDGYGSMINLEESDFVNQILFEHCFGYRLRFSRIGQQHSPTEPVP